MKKHIILFAAMIAALLLVPGCYPNENVELKTKGLTISLFSDEPETKADPTYETKITHFDYFFFTDEGGTSTDGPIYQGRVTGSSKTFETGLGKDFVNLRKVTSYLYVIANYPETIDHTKAWTLAELKALPVEAELVKSIDSETGAATFCSDMVMDSYAKSTQKYTVELTPAFVEEVRTVNVGLTRIASKLVLNFTIPESLPGSIAPHSSDYDDEVWTPVLKDLRAYYVNALNNRSTVDATPVQRSAIPEADVNKYKYFSYPTNYSINPDPLTATPTSGNYEFTTGDVYTYPQTWTAGENGEPYFKIQMTWRSNIRGTSNFYYKICVPKPASDGKVTIDRNTCYVVDVTLDVIDTENEYVVLDPVNYKVTQWAISEWKGGSDFGSARFFDVPNTSFTMYSDTELSVPFSSSSAVSAYFTEISYTHYGAASKTDATFSYPYSYDTSDFGETCTQVTLPTSGVLSAAVDPNPYKLTVENGFVKFEHALTKVYTKRSIKFVIVNPEQNKSVTITVVQHPAIEIRKIAAKNAFVNGHFGRSDEDVHDVYGNYLGTQYGPTQHYDTGKMKFYSHEHLGTYSSNPDIDLTSYGFANVYTDWAPSVKAGQMFLTEITISAFDGTNDTYKMSDSGSGTRTEHFSIGDPRMPASDHYTSATQTGWSVSSTTNFWLPDYLVTDNVHRTKNAETGDWEYTPASFEHGEWEEPLKVLIAAQGDDMRTVIAPKFLVSSALNGMHGGVRFDGSVRRAATYQENGYPAGRWRLPTEAEIAFIVARQRDGSIPELFVFGSTKYWCANRKYVNLGSEGSTTGISIYNAGTNSGFNRFVYDLWYWGDDPESDPDCYHPNKHLVKPNPTTNTNNNH